LRSYNFDLIKKIVFSETAEPSQRFLALSYFFWSIRNTRWLSLKDTGLTKPGEVGDFFALVSMKSPNFCQKAKL
jgi:hypothetical protein